MIRAPLKLVVPPPERRSESDEDLVAAAIAGDREARGLIYDRHGDHVFRVLRRVLGGGEDLSDLQHDVFVRAIAGLASIEDRSALKAWLTRIAVFVARDAIETRQRRRRWFAVVDELPEIEVAGPGADVREAVHATYAILGAMPADDRIAFALRFIEGLELAEVAAACGTSLATIKRRLVRAGDRFANAARRSPVLEPWLQGGTRWSDPSKR